MRHKNRFSKRKYIKNAFQTWNYLGHAGTPSKLSGWGSRHKSWMPFISRMDKKYSHRIMRKQMDL